MQISGRCHCGNVSFVLDWAPDPTEIPARACTCSFCTRHGGIWTSTPSGSLAVRIEQPSLVSRYAFGTKTASFLICSRCGVAPVVTSRIDGRLYAVVNVNTFDGVEPSLLRRVPATFDGESEDARLARRRRHWIAEVELREHEGEASSR